MSPGFEEVILMINSEVDVLRARKESQRLANELGMTTVDSVKVATAVSEIAFNALFHAQKGTINLQVRLDGRRMGLKVVVSDKGPGIPDLDDALRDGYSTSNSLGIGMGAARRLMDEFEVTTQVGTGTTISMTKWTE